MAQMLSFSVLGPIEIATHDRKVMLQGTIQQTLLAMFLANGEKLITVDAMIEELWGSTPPATVENALQANVSRLRRSLARLEPRRKTSRLVTRASGYEFSLQRAELDATTLVETVESIHARASRRAGMDLREVLTLWRGPVFGGLAGGPICQAAIAKYQECRTNALVMLYEFELAAGHHARITPELTELVAENPLHECFASLLMLGLYRSGRQTDSLAVARRLRARLMDELGIELSPVLRELEHAILTHDPRLNVDGVEVLRWSRAGGRAA